MPGPPPPPPMAPPSMMPPPPTPFTPSKGGPDDRGALLKSIQKGTKLKKTVTNDKSAPLIGGSISNNNSNSSINNSPSGGSSSSSSAAPNGLNLGGLFAGGMPKLRATGKLGGPSNFNSGSSNNINNNESQKKKPEIPPQPVKSMTSVQNELKKQMASDNRNRGPPPPAPVRNISESEPEGSKPLMKTTSTNGLRANNSSLHPNNSQQGQNSNNLHRKAKSNVNLSSLDSTDAAVNGFSSQPAKPVINYGKPNLAPKPPALNGKPATPPKKLVMNGKPVSRAHSMRSPRSPSPQSPDVSSAIKFGTVRNLSSVIGQSLGHSTGNLSPRPRPMLNGRPTAPPPSIPSQTAPPPPPHHGTSPQSSAPPPPSKTGIVRPPNHAPPPPPGALPQPPSHAPPPPPHRTHNTMRAPPVAPSNLNAPPPPPRHSSMRETTGNVARKPTTYVDLDERYKHMFNPSSMFPRPPPYKHIIKLYSSKQAGSKQQAPQPPNLQSTSKTWNASSAC